MHRWDRPVVYTIDRECRHDEMLFAFAGAGPINLFAIAGSRSGYSGGWELDDLLARICRIAGARR